MPKGKTTPGKTTPAATLPNPTTNLATTGLATATGLTPTTDLAATTAAEVARRLRAPRTVPNQKARTVADGSGKGSGIRLDALDDVEPARTALAALLDEPGLFFAPAEIMRPGLIYARPRLGFVAAARATHPRHSPSWLQSLAKPEERAYRCRFTEVSFVLPASSPMPCLFLDYLHIADHEDAFDREGELVPLSDSLNPAMKWEAWIVHPALAVEGPATVLQAMATYAASRYTVLVDELETMAALLCLLSDEHAAEARTSTIGTAELADALTTWEPERAKYVRKASGWRSLGYVREP
ncbi:MAG: hypothetical protein AAGG50_03065 [Bacteroidota bacterium]